MMILPIIEVGISLSPSDSSFLRDAGDELLDLLLGDRAFAQGNAQRTRQFFAGRTCGARRFSSRP